MNYSRLSEFRNFPVPDRFRKSSDRFILQKNVFLSIRKMALFIYLTELNFVRPLSFELFFLFGPKIHKFLSNASSVKLYIVSY